MAAALRTKPEVANPSPHLIDSLPPNPSVSLAMAAYSTQLDAAEIPPSSSTLYSDQPRYPTSYATPTKKRNISETTDSTIPTRSTESTPKKMYHPEAKVQSLQNKLMDALIGRIWVGDVAIPFAKGRKMFLTYSELSPYNAALMLGQVLRVSNIRGSTQESGLLVASELSLMVR
jgi:hypothetical protein